MVSVCWGFLVGGQWCHNMIFLSVGVGLVSHWRSGFE